VYFKVPLIPAPVFIAVITMFTGVTLPGLIVTAALPVPATVPPE
jgi:hypothetical protein